MQPGRIRRHLGSRSRQRARPTRPTPTSRRRSLAIGMAAALLTACVVPPPDMRTSGDGERPRRSATQPYTAQSDRSVLSASPVRRHVPRPRLTASASADAHSGSPRPSVDVSLGVAFRRARDLIERETATDLSSVRLQLVDDAAMLAEVVSETRRMVHGQLGEGPLATRLLSSLVTHQSGTYAALYTGEQESVMVSRRVLASYLDSLSNDPAVRDEALLVLMLHELVHAADDRRHGIHDNRALDFRASFAQSAAFEGHAQWLTRKICRREGCVGGLDALDAFMFDDSGASTALAPRAGAPAQDERSSPVDRNLLEYSYVEGERFVAAIAERENGARLIEQLLSDPPHDPLQILDPSSFPDVARERRNRTLLDRALGVPHAWLDGNEPRVAIATSPLKGVNLRNDPSRRAAAIDGFTRLVTAMVSVQFHDPSTRALAPVEVTLMRTDRPTTARLFAETLHGQARLRGTERPAELPGRSSTGVQDPDQHRRSLQRTVFADGDDSPWRTAIASDGPFVIQASGRLATSGAMDDYVLAVLAALLDGEPA